MSANYQYDIKNGDLIIWENWYSVVEHQLNRNRLDQDPQLLKLKEFSTFDGDRKIKFVIYMNQN